MEIEMKEAKKFEAVHVPDDVYPATIVHINEIDLEYGASLLIGFQLVSPGEHNNKIVEGICTKSLNENTKLYSWIKMLDMPLPQVGTNFEIENMIGKTCRVVTGTKDRIDKENKQFKQSFVSRVLPLAEETQ